MKIIQNGTSYDIYNNGIVTHDILPAQNYIVRRSEKRGFWLDAYPSVEITEPKIYGEHLGKVAKVLSSFKVYTRNLGVILSGDKGIGKSLCAKILASEAVRLGYPVIFVDTFYQGIASFLEQIDQECMIMFDEFDKTFGGVRTAEGTTDAQAGLLTLFDGISPGKKLFVVTCNTLGTLNDYLVNRPGRFHYHFRFDYPTAEEVSNYLKDKLNPEYWNEIDNVVSFSRKVALNYDCLRSIVFELNLGQSFSEAIKDLNILNLREEGYVVFMHFTDGSHYTKKVTLDLFSASETYFSISDTNKTGTIEYNVAFNPVNAIYSPEHGGIILAAKDAMVTIDEVYSDKERKKEEGKKTLEYIRFVKERSKNYHYAV